MKSMAVVVMVNVQSLYLPSLVVVIIKGKGKARYINVPRSR